MSYMQIMARSDTPETDFAAKALHQDVVGEVCELKPHTTLYRLMGALCFLIGLGCAAAVLPSTQMFLGDTAPQANLNLVLTEVLLTVFVSAALGMAALVFMSLAWHFFVVFPKKERLRLADFKSACTWRLASGGFEKPADT